MNLERLIRIFRPRKIEKLVKIFEKSNISVLEVSNLWGKKIRLIKTRFNSPEKPEQKKEILTNPNQEKPKEKEYLTIKSNENSVSMPIGIFYFNHPEYDKPPIMIKEDDKISKEQVLGYIEIFKDLNEIISPYDGIIRKIYCKNGSVIQYGEPLFEIEKLE